MSRVIWSLNGSSGWVDSPRHLGRDATLWCAEYGVNQISESP